MTYHLDEQGNKVADLNDTLHIKSLDSCFKCKLVFQRVAESGAEAKSVCHFNVDAYEACTEDPSSEDSYYISNEWVLIFVTRMPSSYHTRKKTTRITCGACDA